MRSVNKVEQTLDRFFNDLQPVRQRGVESSGASRDSGDKCGLRGTGEGSATHGRGSGNAVIAWPVRQTVDNCRTVGACLAGVNSDTLPLRMLAMCLIASFAEVAACGG